jgi:threonine aldolase
MVRAELGDEQRCADPTVNRLEARVAALLGKEQAVLVPSATMANQIALSLHCSRGGEVVCHRTAHVYNYEAGGLARNARAQVFPIDGEGGFFDGDTLRRATRGAGTHLARTRAVVVENTTNVPGGRVWPDESFDSMLTAARALGLAVHLDGARLWNAAIRAGVPVSRWSRHVDTVSVCFSKGLGCPFGAVLAGGREDMDEARHVKQALGGALRQSGIIAAAMEYALDHHVERLVEDHERATRIARGLAAIAELELWLPETNMVYFRHRELASEPFANLLERAGVLVSEVEGRLRLCTHLGIDDTMADEAVAIIERVARNR